eukprot:NODE_10177_length_1371_cov_5.877814.p1 GENE.NODE_10177_length_1371_cov_5.877814~~NODE_10177_length_1371_cov_5.877814.p1  ORF type:complete len:282 (+),score=45.85 NODE_10177_length_1371_cov_5.877814:256-1101(+)
MGRCRNFFRAITCRFIVVALITGLTLATSRSRWNDYDEQVMIAYCMWKHQDTRVCTNALRTNCPEDDSCCPVSQQRLSENSDGSVRASPYVCQKSPILGLYCQHDSYRTPWEADVYGNFTLGNELCTAVSCPTFEWCRDLVDFPNTCVGETCKEYGHLLNFVIACIFFSSLAFTLDAFGSFRLAFWPMDKTRKARIDVMSACLKALVCLLCVAGGGFDFITTAIDHACFTKDGNDELPVARMAAYRVTIVAGVSALCSACLGPLMMRWMGRITNVPYVPIR